MLAVPDPLKMGSRKPELRTNRLTSWPVKDPLDSCSEIREAPKQIPNPQAEFLETSGVRKDSRDSYCQIPDISDPQVDFESVDLQAKPRDCRRIPEILRQLRNHRLIGRSFRDHSG